MMVREKSCVFHSPKRRRLLTVSGTILLAGLVIGTSTIAEAARRGGGFGGFGGLRGGSFGGGSFGKSFAAPRAPSVVRTPRALSAPKHITSPVREGRKLRAHDARSGTSTLLKKGGKSPVATPTKAFTGPPSRTLTPPGCTGALCGPPVAGAPIGRSSGSGGYSSLRPLSPIPWLPFAAIVISGITIYGETVEPIVYEPIVVPDDPRGFVVGRAKSLNADGDPCAHLAPIRTPEEASELAGMLERHIVNLSRYCAAEKKLVIVRGTDPDVRNLIDNPRFVAKPLIIKDKTRWGRLLDGSSRHLREVDGKYVHSDYDLQLVAQLQGDGKFTDVYSRQDEIVRDLNERVTPEKPMFQHPWQDAWWRVDEKRARTYMGRVPEPDERFLICQPDGTMRVVDTAKSLKICYGKWGLNWPYDELADTGLQVPDQQ
jgi:hypothetical protein